MSAQPRKHQRTLVAICLACSVLVMGMYAWAKSYRRLEMLAGDWLATNPAARLSPHNPEIIFLGIGDASRTLDTLFDEEITASPTLQMMKAGFPWNRAVYARIMERLIGAGAKAVILDVIMPGPREGDEELRAALDRFRNHVVLGSNLATQSEDSGGDGSGALSLKPLHILPSRTLIPPPPPYDSRVGFVNVQADADGKVRRANYRTTILEFFGHPPEQGSEELFSLAARALQKSGHEALIPKDHGLAVLRFSEDILPRSVEEIFVENQWKNPPYNNGELFRGKIVLIGATGNAAEDRLQTPFGVVLGPTIHLSAINAALNRDFLHETSIATDLALIGGAGLLAWLLGTWVRKPFERLLSLIGALAGYVILVQLLFNYTGFFPILLSPLLALSSSGFTWSVWEQVLDRLEKAKLRKTFERYVSHDVVKELLDNPQGWLNTSGGERRNVTMLFSDVRGFTTLTESAEDPHALVAQLNEYFTEMVGIVFANHGTLDKFIGDAVMAHWGSMSTKGEGTDAQRAVATALQMLKALDRLNPQWKERGMLELRIGIGVNHGEVIAGNLGASGKIEKMEFTVIGDAVNLASRLEGVTKTYHIDLCIGEQVAPFVREAFILRSLDLIVVKGKTKPVEIFTVLDERNATTAEPPWLAPHEEAMRLYRTGQFSAAEKLWREVLAQHLGDGVSEVFIERCATLQKEPPEGDWSGVFEMKSK